MSNRQGVEFSSNDAPLLDLHKGENPVMKKLVVGTVLLLLSAASAFADATWTTDKYDPDSWTANANNLLKEATPTNEGLSF